MPKHEQKKLGRERLERIIDLCKSVEARGLDPFLVDVESIIPIIREYFPEWKSPEELSLDAVTVHQIASAITLQSDWIKHRSTSLYTDPFLIKTNCRDCLWMNSAGSSSNRGILSWNLNRSPSKAYMKR